MSGFGKKKPKHRPKTMAVETKAYGIQFKSKLEAYMYTKLRKLKIPCDYEKITFTIMPGFTASIAPWQTRGKGKRFTPRAPKIRPITYTPDFTAKDESWIIEVKGRKFDTFRLKWKLFLRYLRANDKNPEVFMPTNRKECDQVANYLKEIYHGT